MTKLSDTQRILLSSAAQRENGSVLPLPPTIAPGGGTSKAIAALLRNAFVDERETDDMLIAVRTDDDVRYGLFITNAGAAAIGIDLAGPSTDDDVPDATTPLPSARPARTSKSATVLALLERAEGATITELIEATGWLPHTTRAALTGLRKKGHAITRGKRAGATCYTAAVQV